MKLTGRVRLGLAGLALVAVVAAVVALRATSSTKSTVTGDLDYLGVESGGAVVGKPAPELVGLDAWINSSPLTLKGLQGKVVLVDFWTYTCVNCIRTFPYLRAWQERYAPNGLVIVGVHSPEFAFEKSLPNVQEAARRYGLTYPIALDNNHATWTNFRNQYWPRKYLIDRKGIVRYDHIGEGGYEETERQIRKLLAESGAPLGEGPGVKDPEPGSAGLFRLMTPELYAGARGFLSGQIGNVDEYKAGMPVQYTWPSKPKQDALYLKGLWQAQEESVRHARTTQEYQDGVLLRYHAASVNLVIRPEGSEPFDALVWLDREPMEDLVKGKDVSRGADGNTYLHIEGARLYNVVNAPEFGGHELRVLVKSDAFALYSLTFGLTPEQ